MVIENSRNEKVDKGLDRGSDVVSDRDLDAEEKKKTEEEEEEIQTVERIFESKEVPPWQKQLTFRAFFVSFVLGILFTFIVMKLNLTTGIIPSLNVSAGLLGFFFVKTWTKLLQKSGLLKQPFTRQENTVIQTCVVASSGIAFSDWGAKFDNIRSFIGTSVFGLWILSTTGAACALSRAVSSFL